MCNLRITQKKKKNPACSIVRAEKSTMVVITEQDKIFLSVKM